MLNLKNYEFILLCSAAGGLGWGIRGQYGHESGATMAACLVSFAIGIGLWGRIPFTQLLRALSLAALVTGFGGSMTYGQTLGLTQDAPLIGNWESWRWGMLGIFIKGGLWISFFGLFLGIGLSRNQFNINEITVHSVLSVFVLFLGVALLNEPFDPEEKILPYFYFSDHWKWEPDSILSPRREKWGGLLCVLLYWISLTLFVKKQALPIRLATFGFIFGGIGFCAGQAIQSFHAWNPGFLGSFNEYINWWNMMETAFGAIWGAGMAIGVLSSRRQIFEAGAGISVEKHKISKSSEWIALVIMAIAGLAWNIGSFEYFDYFADLAWTMIIVPLVLVSVGSIWPVAWINVIVLLPISAKTIRELSYNHQEWNTPTSYIFLGVIPFLLACWASKELFRGISKNNVILSYRSFLASALGMTWIYFLLNFAFFRFPWIWAPWTPRTLNGIIFLTCTLLMTYLGLKARRSLSNLQSSNPIDQGD